MIDTTQRRLATVVTFLLALRQTLSAELTGGISNVGGVQLQEEEYLAQARARGESIVEIRPLLSENDKFWAQVEPVSRYRQLQARSGRYGPKLLISRSRRALLDRRKLSGNSLARHETDSNFAA